MPENYQHDSFFASAAPPHPDNIAFNRVKPSTPLHHRPNADKQPTMLDMIANLTARVEALEKGATREGGSIMLKAIGIIIIIGLAIWLATHEVRL